MLNRHLARGSELIAFALCFSFLACNSSRCPDGTEDRGFFSDAPLPTLCRTDHLEFSPSSAVLTLTRDGAAAPGAAQGGTSASPMEAPDPASNGGVGAPETGAGENSLTMAVLATDEANQPRDTMNVDVRVCGGEGLIEVAPKDAACDQVTATRLQCRTSSAGVAQFQVVGRGGSGMARVCAISGRQGEIRADIEVRSDDVATLKLEVGSTDTYGEASALSCTTVPCKQNVRRVTAYLSARDAAGDVTTVVRDRDVFIELAVLAGSGVSLSETADCVQASAPFSVTLPSSGRSRPFYVCAGSQAAEVELTANPPGLSPARVPLKFPAVPASVALSEAEQTGAGGGGGDTSVHVDVRDCNGNPLPGIAVSIAADGQASSTVTTDALGGAQITTAGESVTVGITDPATGRVMSAECSL